MNVFLHGWGMSRYVFESFVDDCLSGQDNLLLDLPGYDEGEVSLEASFDEQVEALMQKVPQGSHLLAWSLGGLYALRLVQLYPQHLSKLTLICSTPCFRERDDFPHAMKVEVLNQFGDQLLKNRDKTVARFLMLQLHGHKDAKQVVKQLKHQIARIKTPAIEVLEKGLSYLMELDLRVALAECLVPVQFILGKNDRLVPFSVKNDLLAINSKVSVDVIDKSAHLPFITNAREFHSLVTFD